MSGMYHLIQEGNRGGSHCCRHMTLYASIQLCLLDNMLNRIYFFIISAYNYMSISSFPPACVYIKISNFQYGPICRSLKPEMGAMNRQKPTFAEKSEIKIIYGVLTPPQKIIACSFKKMNILNGHC